MSFYIEWWWKTHTFNLHHHHVNHVNNNIVSDTSNDSQKAFHFFLGMFSLRTIHTKWCFHTNEIFYIFNHTIIPYLHYIKTAPILFISDICVCGNPFIIHHHSLLPFWFVQSRRISHRVVISEDEHVTPPYHMRQMQMHA